MTGQMWHIAQDGQQIEGTHTTDQVVRIALQTPAGSFLVWRQGQDGWLPPGEVPEIAAHLVSPAQASHRAAEPATTPRVGTSSAAGDTIGGAAVQRNMGFVRSLFDVRFENLVTPKMMSVLYLVSMILVGLGLLAMLFSGLTQIVSGIRFGAWGMAFFGLVWVVISPILAILYLALIRVFFEVVTTLFAIREDLSSIAHRSED